MSTQELTDEEQNHIVKIEFEEARQLADAASICQDLSFVLDTLKRLRATLAEEAPDSLLVQSYWTAALVAYVRCFSSGKRGGLSESVFDGIQGPKYPAIEVHNYYRGLRDKHIAHSVNPFEQVKVGAILSPPSAPDRKVEGVGVLSGRHICVDLKGVDALYALARVAHKKTREKCKRLERTALDIAAKLDLKELYLRETLRITVPAPEQAGQPRG